jgi:hypothetical protein
MTSIPFDYSNQLSLSGHNANVNIVGYCKAFNDASKSEIFYSKMLQGVRFNLLSERRMNEFISHFVKIGTEEFSFIKRAFLLSLKSFDKGSSNEYGFATRDRYNVNERPSGYYTHDLHMLIYPSKVKGFGIRRTPNSGSDEVSYEQEILEVCEISKSLNVIEHEHYHNYSSGIRVSFDFIKRLLCLYVDCSNLGFETRSEIYGNEEEERLKNHCELCKEIRKMGLVQMTYCKIDEAGRTCPYYFITLRGDVSVSRSAFEESFQHLVDSIPAEGVSEGLALDLPGEEAATPVFAPQL